MWEVGRWGCAYVYLMCCDVSIKGGELFEFIETEGHVDEDVTVRLLRQVLEGVEFLHSHNILHMDVKVCVCRGLMVLCYATASTDFCRSFLPFCTIVCKLTLFALYKYIS